MPRRAREKSSSGIYHIVLRGINKQTVFYDDEDKEVLLNRIQIVKEQIDFDIYAFCFMTNHIHLLIKEKESTIGEIIRKCLSSYVFWYNSKYERVGNLFQDRFSSETIEDNEYLLCAARYIHQNPVKAGIVQKPSEYNWSSYQAYLNEKNNLIETTLILEVLQGKEGYEKFMEEVEKKKFIEPTETYKISDDKLIKEIIKKLEIKEIKAINNFSRKELEDKVKQVLEIEGTNPFQVSRVTGITMGLMRSILA